MKRLAPKFIWIAVHTHARVSMPVQMMMCYLNAEDNNKNIWCVYGPSDMLLSAMMLINNLNVVFVPLMQVVFPQL